MQPLQVSEMKYIDFASDPATALLKKSGSTSSFPGGVRVRILRPPCVSSSARGLRLGGLHSVRLLRTSGTKE